MKIHITLTLLISILFSTGSFSQLQVGIGFIGGFPTGEFDDINNFGSGIYLEGKFGVNDKSNIGLEVSGIYFARSERLSSTFTTMGVHHELLNPLAS